MKKIRIGVFGGGRGQSMMEYAKKANDVELVAVCDKYPDVIERAKAACGTEGIAYYDNFEDFLQHDMDAVVLANYANEHAPFAIRCLKAGKHVFSEVLPVQTMKEAVELIEAIEESGLVYAYGENYCYMPGTYEMRRLYRSGKLGEFEYGEGEYIHNCEPIWPDITYGERAHWRNNVCATFYCTHSMGPIIHITGLRPVRVTGYESLKTERNLRGGSKSGQFGIEMVELENGGIVKSIHGGLYKNSIWYTIYGSLGRAETAREDAELGGPGRIYVNTDEASGAYDTGKLTTYEPSDENAEAAAEFGHGNSDFYTMYNFVKKIRGEADADTIDIFEALDMFLPGLFAYRSILAGGIPMEIPNLRNADERGKWRNDTACTVPQVAGAMLQPTNSGGTPEIPQEVYDKVRAEWIRRTKG
ncbi:MAG: Gfo/Idh/MocA family oxidoreductase [Clostridia bacterium]|nr:Gfo/Idh/MocA family oxidoreductase [Clostridia bacterium]